jgi:hypothetical protein
MVGSGFSKERVMNFAGMNYLAILVAAIVAFVIGAVYYGSLSKPWMKAARLDPDGPKPAIAPLMITTFILELGLAFVTAGMIGHLGDGQVTTNQWADFGSLHLGRHHLHHHDDQQPLSGIWLGSDPD